MTTETELLVNLVEASVAKTLTDDWIAGRGKPTRERLLQVLYVRREAALKCGERDVCIMALLILQLVEKRFEERF